jgi:beta-galactosidase GanA
MTNKSLIPYGATYSPLVFEESGWERDLDLMARADINILRVGDIGTWERVEAKEGKYDLEALARFYTLADQYGIQIMIGTSSCTPPLWLAQKYPEIRIKSSRGERYPLGASYHWACVHHPAFLEASQKYIAALADFTVKQPNHFGWQISNEIGFPFNPTRESGDIDLYCYCDHTKDRFQEWMKDKYGSIDKVTTAWTWSTSNFIYRDWTDLFPPEGLPKTWSSMTRWLDWRLFWQQAFTDHASWEHQQIRQYDTDHPTSVNTFNFKGFDRFGTYTGLDQWKKSKVVDNIGYDLYPGSGNKLASRPEHSSMFLDHGRSVSHFAGSEFWIHEVESGPISGWLMGPDHKTDEKDILNMCLESIGHDAKMVVYMPYKEWSFMPLRWGALVDLNSNPTPRYEAAALIGRYLIENAPFLKKARVPKGEVAILESKSNAIVLRGMGQEDQLFQAQRGVYSGFWEQGYRVDFINDDLLLEGKADDYRVICLPLMGLISRELAAALKAYAAGGGVVIGFARCGTLDEMGWFQTTLPIPELGDLFGLDGIEADHRDNIQIDYQGAKYQSWLNRDLINTREGTEILATFEDGHPAVTLHAVGKGYGIYLATQADSGYLKPETRVLKNAIGTIQDRTGYLPYLSIQYPDRKGREIDPHILDTPNRTEVLITNYALQEKQVEITLRESERVVDKSWIGLPEKKELKVKQSATEVSFTVKLEEKEVQTITIVWQ